MEVYGQTWITTERMEVYGQTWITTERMEVYGQTWITTESMKSNESGFVMISQFIKCLYMLKKALIYKIYKQIYLLKNIFCFIESIQVQHKITAS